MISWKLLQDSQRQGQFKPHVVVEELSHPILLELSARGGQDMKATPHEGEQKIIWSWDAGGMCMADRSMEKIPVGDVFVEVPSNLFSSFVRYLEAMEAEGPRQALGFSYFKIHNPWNCLVLTPQLFVELLRNAQPMVRSAEERGHQDDDRLRKSILRAQAAGAPVLSMQQEVNIANLPLSGKPTGMKH